MRNLRGDPTHRGELLGAQQRLLLLLELRFPVLERGGHLVELAREHGDLVVAANPELGAVVSAPDARYRLDQGFHRAQRPRGKGGGEQADHDREHRPTDDQ